MALAKKALIWTASAIWSSASALAREAKRRGLTRAVTLDTRVIGVGNLQAGGAGKTPLVAMIANEAHARGLHVCILTRGYRGGWEKSGGVIAPEKRVRLEDAGDEAMLLHDLAPHAWIGVGANRIKQFAAIRERAKRSFDIVLLDDAFQNWRIRKDVEIVAVTSRTRFEKVHRDWAAALKAADLIVWTKGEAAPRLPSSLRAPCVRVEYRVQKYKGPARFWLITSVADEGFVRDLAEKSGFDVQKQIAHRDHKRFTEAQVARYLEQAEEDDCKVLLTGKDWVKWRELGAPLESVAVLEPELVIVSGKDEWRRTLWDSSS